jgi:CBS domain-containing protein
LCNTYSRTRGDAWQYSPLEHSIQDIATILAHPDTPLIIVCDSEGVALGVVSSTDIVNALSRDCNKASTPMRQY